MHFTNSKKLAVTLILFAASALQARATTRRVLFIGNSYTYTNNMPLMLQTLAAALGDTLIYDQSDPGGFTLEEHSSYAPTISKIFSQPWDIVVLQEQSELPAFPPDQVDTQVYPYARKLDSMIKANDSCTQTMFLMTWGHADGDPPNCDFYPIVCTYDGMQQRLHDSYMQMTQDNNAIVAPVGVAWKVMRDSFPSLWLYQADSVHPIVPGSYIETCVLYSSIFHKRTSGATYVDGLDAADAATIQRIADKVTLDSIAQWQQYGHYPDAAFYESVAGRTANFYGVPTVPAYYSWQFGDGGSDTSLSPAHSYTATGDYTVSHTASNSCFSETITDIVHISDLGILAASSNSGLVQAVPQGNGYVAFTATSSTTIDVYDADGRQVKSFINSGQTDVERFIPGFYIYRARIGTGKEVVCRKLVVY